MLLYKFELFAFKKLKSIGKILFWCFFFLDKCVTSQFYKEQKQIILN